ncbi:MAG: hypothetical protein JF599_13745 [Verrucomicrobia bacterium]|nr:hypothetical protein [Verrucomicrobiota bacterium]
MNSDYSLGQSLLVSSSMIRRSITYQEGQYLPGQGSPVFVTVMEIDQAGGQIIQESHVFIPGSGKHLSRVMCRGLSGLSLTEAEDQCTRATYSLFVNHIMAHDRKSLIRLTDPYQPYQKKALKFAPFSKFRSEQRFVREMEEILEWTKSEDLRCVLTDALTPTAGLGEGRNLSLSFPRTHSRIPRVCGMRGREARRSWLD